MYLDPVCKETILNRVCKFHHKVSFAGKGKTLKMEEKKQHVTAYFEKVSELLTVKFS